MGHHIDTNGRFQSDKHPGLAPDRIIIHFNDPHAEKALRILANDYLSVDPGLSEDILERVNTIYG